MTELERSIVDAGSLYNELMRHVSRDEVSTVARERISRIQRRIARHYNHLVPGTISADYQMALNTTEPTDLDAKPLDPTKLIDRCIHTGNTYAALFEELPSISADLAEKLGPLFADNATAFESIVGFETYDHDRGPAFPRTS